MESLLFLNHKEYHVLKKNKDMLEHRNKLKIFIPDIKKYESSGSEEIISVQIVGENQSINNVENFLKRKVEEKENRKRKSTDSSIIILTSDSDSTCDSEIHTPVSKNKSKKRKKKQCKGSLTIAKSSLDTHHSSSSTTSTTKEADESVLILEPNEDSNPSIKEQENFIPLIQDESVIIVGEEDVSLSSVKNKDFIPLKEDGANCSNSFIPKIIALNEKQQEVSSPSSEVIDLASDDEEILPIIPIQPCRRLRPIVIDGSNVARAHGKITNTYSCKGIKLSIEYFLKRGHTQVTAFVPLFRRHCFKGNVRTTDPEILDELEKTQQVVFTPSRKLDKKSYSCYDDRFIVELASKNNGVILSNDNYKDLIDESPEFKEAIQNRLLMFCFVGDLIMIPNDPLGSKGPKLEDYLSFPPDENS